MSCKESSGGKLVKLRESLCLVEEKLGRTAFASSLYIYRIKAVTSVGTALGLVHYAPE
jgi:hypothetical protein